VNSEMYIDILRRLREASEGNVLKNGEPTGRFSFTTMLQHTHRFWSRISYQRTMWRYRSIPLPSWTGSSWCLPFARRKSVLKGWLFRDATDIIENVTEKLKRISQNGLQECIPRLLIHCKKCIVP